MQCAQCFTYPSPFSFLFPPSPQFYYIPSSIFFIPSFTISLFSLLNFVFPPPHLFYIFFHPNTSTPYQPCIDPRLNFFQHSFVKLHTTTTFFHRHTTTFLLFSLQHHHNSIVSLHHHHISIVFSPPPPHFYSFPKRQARFRPKRTTSGQNSQNQAKKAKLK